MIAVLKSSGADPSPSRVGHGWVRACRARLRKARSGGEYVGGDITSERDTTAKQGQEK
ncbi:MAG TPA: hypothetical protein VFF39_04995 [Verrucomicrobiae bacterium]|nr:hypothetical protein [Verrucomicrobiae bacterium]